MISILQVLPLYYVQEYRFSKMRKIQLKLIAGLKQMSDEEFKGLVNKFISYARKYVKTQLEIKNLESKIIVKYPFLYEESQH